MIWLLFSLLGFGAVAGAGGGGSRKASETAEQQDNDTISPDMAEHDADGHDADGHGADGHGADGHGADGHGADGHGADGHGADGHGADGHGADGHGLPISAEEIIAFVEAVKNNPETHVHDVGSPKLGEHQAAMELVARPDATHIAISNGSWFDPNTWHNGEVPGDDARALIPENVQIQYDDTSDARIYTLRVDGELEFATDTDSKVIVDTFVVSPSGTLTIGTQDTPVEADVNVDIVIANNGQIDTDWDPSLLSRGLISHGKTEIHGQLKDSHAKVSEDPMAGDDSVAFEALPEGWQVGDEIVVAGTKYLGYRWDNTLKQVRLYESEDEVRIITRIEDNEVFFDDPLEHDHDSPRADLHTSVANMTRNVTVRSEDGDDSEIFERGHVMLMHSDDVDVRYAAFDELGRTDKSESAKDASAIDNIAFDSNIKGRYGLHLHKLGISEADDPAVIIGNTVSGSPGWGFVHHDSNAILQNNASFDTFGAGFVAESGNETGIWDDNIAILAQGRSWADPKVQITDLAGFDTGVSGDGFWFQGRMVEATNNIAASVNNGYVYFHRGPTNDNAHIRFDAEAFALPEGLFLDEDILGDDAPILVFEDNEAFAAKEGLHIVKSNPNQGHDIHSVIDGFTAWSVITGAHLEYTSHYTLKDFDLVGKVSTPFSTVQSGIDFNKNVSDITIVDAKIDGFETGIDFVKGWSSNIGITDSSLHDYTVVGVQITNTTTDFDNYDPALDTVIERSDLPGTEVSLELDAPLVYFNWPGTMEITGTKTDSLGTSEFPSGTDKIELDRTNIVNLLEENGYFEADDGKNYMILDLYMSDRVSGDIFKQSELVELASSVDVGTDGSPYAGAVSNGKATLAELQDATDNGAELVIRQEDLRTDVENAIKTAEDASAPEMHHTSHAMIHTQEIGDALISALSNGQEPLSEDTPDTSQNETEDEEMMVMSH